MEAYSLRYGICILIVVSPLPLLIRDECRLHHSDCELYSTAQYLID